MNESTYSILSFAGKGEMMEIEEDDGERERVW